MASLVTVLLYIYNMQTIAKSENFNQVEGYTYKYTGYMYIHAYFIVIIYPDLGKSNILQIPLKLAIFNITSIMSELQVWASIVLLVSYSTM